MNEDDRRRKELAASAVALADEVGQLAERLDTSNRHVADLSARNERLNKQAKKHSWWIVATVAGLILDVALTVFLLSANAELQDTNARLEAAQVRLNTSVRESCAFYALILGSYRPETRPVGRERDEYEAAFVLMRQSYRALECDPKKIVPPAVPR